MMKSREHMMKRSAHQQSPAGYRPRRVAARGLAVAAAAGLAVCSLPAAGGAAVSAGGTTWATAPLPTTIFSWGDNTHGQLGDGGTEASSAVPVAVDLPAGTAVTAAALTGVDGYAVTAQGQVWAWGDNRGGQLGDGGKESGSNIPVQVSLPLGTSVTSVEPSNDHVLALTSTGAVLAWGDNHWGQLGDGQTEAESDSPVQVPLPAGVRITAVSAGADYSLALTATGQVYAWGSNDFGRLGEGSDHIGEIRTTPVLLTLPLSSRVTAISAGNTHALAATAQDWILAWGSNFYGELGDGGAEQESVAPIVIGVGFGSLTPVSSVSAGNQTSMALTSTGQVLTWGRNQDGELGQGNTVDHSPFPLPAFLYGHGLVTAISAGAEQDVVLTATGSVFDWGAAGTLGDGSSSSDSNLPVQVHLPAGLVATSIATAANGQDSLAIVRGTSS
jgi:alpha-tubulin suppressor-like RCC1 family protein